MGIERPTFEISACSAGASEFHEVLGVAAMFSLRGRENFPEGVTSLSSVSGGISDWRCVAFFQRLRRHHVPGDTAGRRQRGNQPAPDDAVAAPFERAEVAEKGQEAQAIRV